MPSFETICPECGRTTGVVAAPYRGSGNHRYKLPVHSSEPPSRGKNRPPRPRCVVGTGLEVSPNAMWETTTTAEERKRTAILEERRRVRAEP